MKNFGILALLAVAAFVAVVDAQNHNIVFGNIGPNDILLHREILTKKSKWLQIVTQDIRYPSSGRVITGIRCTDQHQNGNGGYASLVTGGPGYQEVTIHFKSQRSHGLKFILEIYGR